MYTRMLIVLIAALFSASCSGGCDMNQASNKMLALGKVQGKLASMGGEGALGISLAIGTESGSVSELIAQGKYTEACAKAEEVAKKYHIDLAEEQKDMITMEQLAADGGKGSGTCSIADAAKKQMELHALLQKEVDAGRKTSDVFQQFGQDTLPFAELMSTNPSKACDLIDSLKKKYNL